MTDDFHRHLLANLDLESYSSRNDVQQHQVQQALVHVVDTAAEAAGLDRASWSVQHSGDGALAVLPDGTSERHVVDELPAALARALADHNRAAPAALRLRVRLALHQGLVKRAAAGFAGVGVVTAARMLDCPPARRALVECPDADLVLLLSPLLYVELVLQGHTRLSGPDFREVPVVAKTFRGTAWLHLPGHDVHALALDTPPEPAASGAVEASGAPGAPGSSTTNISGGLHAHTVHIGHRFGR